jgi:hypothetical protein
VSTLCSVTASDDFVAAGHLHDGGVGDTNNKLTAGRPPQKNSHVSQSSSWLMVSHLGTFLSPVSKSRWTVGQATQIPQPLRLEEANPIDDPRSERYRPHDGESMP